MLQISVQKVAQIVLFAHEIERAEAELRGFLEALGEDELVSLVALAWIGRGSFEAEELEEAIQTAREEATTPTPDYLLGMPHFADHLESGLEALGLSASEAEEDLL